MDGPTGASLFGHAPGPCEVLSHAGDGGSIGSGPVTGYTSFETDFRESQMSSAYRPNGVPCTQAPYSERPASCMHDIADAPAGDCPLRPGPAERCRSLRTPTDMGTDATGVHEQSDANF